MNLLLALEQLIRLISLAWFDLRRRRILLPAGIVLLLHAIVLGIAADPTYPLWSGLTGPLFRGIFGDLFLHYPQALIGLPASGSALRLVVDLIVGPWLAVAVLSVSLQTARGRLPLGGWWRGMDRGLYARLFLYGVLTTGLWVAINVGTLRWVLGSDLLSYRNRVLFTYLWGFVPSLLLLPVLFVLPCVVDGERNLLQAVRRSVHHVRPLPLLGSLLVTMPHALGIPFVYVLNRSAILANQLRPELVWVVMVGQSLVAILVTITVLNASARLWVRRRKAEES